MFHVKHYYNYLYFNLLHFSNNSMFFYDFNNVAGVFNRVANVGQ